MAETEMEAEDLVLDNKRLDTTTLDVQPVTGNKITRDNHLVAGIILPEKNCKVQEGWLVKHIYIDCANLMLILPVYQSDGATDTPESHAVELCKVRYAREYGGATEQPAVVISVWAADHTIRNYYYDMGDKTRAHNLCLGIKTLFMISHEKNDIKLRTLIPQNECDMEVYVNDRDPTMSMLSPTSIPENSQYKTHYCILDIEALQVYKHALDLRPIYTFWFFQEAGPDVVENIFQNNNHDFVRVDTPKRSCYIKMLPQHKEQNYDRFLVTLKEMRPKPKQIFRDNEAFIKYFAMGDEMKTGSRRVAELPHPEAEWKENQGNSSLYSTQRLQYSDDSAWQQAINESLLDAGASGLRTSPFGLGEGLNNASEEMQVMWVMAEEEMKAMHKSGYVPESTIESGGLDSMSADHLIKCLDEIQDYLMQQKYDVALSHVQGARKIFQHSRAQSIKKVFTVEDDIELLKQIFFRM